MISYVHFFLNSMIIHNTHSPSHFRFLPKAEDNGKYFSCRATNEHFPNRSKEDGYSLSVKCEHESIFASQESTRLKRSPLACIQAVNHNECHFIHRGINMNGVSLCVLTYNPGELSLAVPLDEARERQRDREREREKERKRESKRATAIYFKASVSFLCPSSFLPKAFFLFHGVIRH